MSKRISRRDFLKVAVFVPAAMTVPALVGCAAPQQTEKSSGPQKLTLWNANTSNTGLMTVLKPMAEKWAASNNASVELTNIPYADHETKLLAAFSSRENAPDVFVVVAAYWAGALGIADPMPDKLAQRMDKEIVETLLPEYKIAGKWYSAPDGGTVWPGPELVYNPEDFQEVGLDPAKPPTTMSELLEYAKKLTKRDGSGAITRGGFAQRYDGALGLGIGTKFLPFLHSFGGRMYDPATGKSDGVSNSPEAIAALDFCTQFTLKEKVSSLAFGAPDAQFGQRQASMMFRESYMYGWLPNNYPKVKFMFAPIPKGTTDKNMGMHGLASWGPLVYKYSPRRDLAWDFLDKTFYTTEADLNQSMLGGFVPAFRSNWESKYVKDRTDYSVLQYSLTHADGIVYTHAKTNKLSDRFSLAVQEALLGKKTPKDALDQAAKDMEAILKA